MTRTAQQEFRIKDPILLNWILELIEKLSHIYYVQIHNLTLMNNHYHLTIRMMRPEEMNRQDVASRFENLQKLNKRRKNWVPLLAHKHFDRFTSLSWFMWDLNRRISIRHNRMHGTKGHLWGARYNSVVIEGDAHLLRAMAYIEQNPVRAKMAGRPSEYPYGTAGRIASDLKRGRTPKVPAIGFLRNFHGKKRAEAYLTWMNFLSDLMINPNLKRKVPPLHVRKLFEEHLDHKEINSWVEPIRNRLPSRWHLKIIKQE